MELADFAAFGFQAKLPKPFTVADVAEAVRAAREAPLR